MSETPYHPEDGDIRVNHHGPTLGPAFFSVATNYGAGKPHYYVCNDENGGEQSWWLGPAEAEALGAELVRQGSQCRQKNEEIDNRGSTKR